jgi:DNA polymerase, archaea type
MPGEMVVWIKKADGGVLRMTDGWENAIYVSADDRRDLDWLVTRKELKPYVSSSCYVSKREQVFHYDEREVLKLVLRRAGEAERLARIVERSAEFGVYRIYNADLLPAQSYFIENDLFPLAKVRVEQVGNSIKWTMLDSVESEEYDIPPLRKAILRVEAECRTIPKFSDPIKKIVIVSGEEILEIETGTERDKLLSLVEEVRRLDPDLLFIEEGDDFTTHYLAERAWANGMLDKMTLSRDPVPLRRMEKRGTSYFAYGRILYTPSSQVLYGRLNLDAANHFVISEAGLDGLIEVARICRMPLHKGSRASIGKCLSSMQFSIAKSENLLIPWKPTRAEVPKTGRALLTGDRGGFVYEPKAGIHEGVGEVDFTSLYPFIMLKFNISAETVLCKCCVGSEKRVPDVGYNICQKRDGVVPRSLELILKKRVSYKKKKEGATSEAARKYGARVDALKGILVCSFGYLSYRNAKFGLIDCHIAVCAFARKVLLDTSKIAERNGFELVHGIVDSLWLKKPGATRKEYEALCREIQAEIGLPVTFEGIYKWIAFLPSRMHDDVPVLNRYFGMFQEGGMKVRGIELRRTDTIKLVADCQREILELFSAATSVDEVRALIPEAIDLFRSYAGLVRSGRARMEDLIIVNRLSKNYNEYTGNTVQASAARQLAEEGLELMAGQSVSYVITRAKSKHPAEKARPSELIDSTTRYDREKYTELLIRGALAILEPLGVGRDELERSAKNLEDGDKRPQAVSLDAYGNQTLDSLI